MRQSSSFIATIAGQAVAEGFLRWRVSVSHFVLSFGDRRRITFSQPVLRRLFTRLIAIIPSMIVAVVVGPEGVSSLLVASQVVLSMALPFITLPLIYLTSSKKIMSVRKIRRETTTTNVASQGEATLTGDPDTVGQTTNNDQELENAGDEWVDFSNSRVTTLVGVLIWLLIVVANVYVLVSL